MDSSSSNLVALHQQTRILPFLAVVVPSAEISLASLLVLTPRVMKWSHVSGRTIWLCDLEPCVSYWQAQTRGQDHLIKIRQVLEHSLGVSFHAAFAEHPWQALLLATHMESRGLSGLVSLLTPIGQNLWRDVPWDIWWSSLDVLGEHWEAVKQKNFRRDALRRGVQQFQRAVPRLGMASPWLMREMDPPALRRRFGATLQEVWTWAYSPRGPRGDVTACGPSLRGTFPWRQEVQAETPQISRWLDAPLAEWEHMQPFLKEDLDRLCKLESWHDSERVLSLEWQLVFSDMTSLEIPVRFRHPHHLHSESGHHRTALLQALYSFNAALPGSRLDPARLDDLLPTIPVISWRLSVEQRMILPKRMRDLFGCETSGFLAESAGSNQPALEGDLDAILRLENRLPVRLESWDLNKDWRPEDSWRVAPRQRSARWDRGVGRQGVEATPSLDEMAKGRPLFIYKQPQPLSQDGRSKLWRFCERTMDKWWMGGGLQRDYYLVTDEDRRKMWVYKDHRGQAHVHGIYA